jgi:Ca2+-binding EF-hand superfamily protein
MQNQFYSQQSSNYNQGSSTVLVNSGLTDQQGARNVAKRILDTYDRDNNGVIDSI